jgi:hypothetical protein
MSPERVPERNSEEEEKEEEEEEEEEEGGTKARQRCVVFDGEWPVVSTE